MIHGYFSTSVRRCCYLAEMLANGVDPARGEEDARLGGSEETVQGDSAVHSSRLSVFVGVAQCHSENHLIFGSPFIDGEGTDEWLARQSLCSGELWSPLTLGLRPPNFPFNFLPWPADGNAPHLLSCLLRRDFMDNFVFFFFALRLLEVLMSNFFFSYSH